MSIVRPSPAFAKSAAAIALPTLGEVIAPEVLVQAIDRSRARGQRRRKLPAELMAVALVVLGLFAGTTLPDAVRKVMAEAARAVAVDPDRVSFVGALRLIRDALPELDAAPTPEARARRYAILLRDVATALNPPRRARSYPRVVKRKMSRFKLKRPAVHGRQLKTPPFIETVRIC